MTSDEIRRSVLKENASCILLEMATGSGKSKLALDIIDNKHFSNPKILIVIPRVALINNWKKEFFKWGYEKYLNNTEFVTYVSFPKKFNHYSAIIYDEVHHLTPRCIKHLPDISADVSLLLSATVGYKKKEELSKLFKGNIGIYPLSLREAIEEELLPDPKIILLKLALDRTKVDHVIIKNPKVNTIPIKVSYTNRFSVAHIKNKRIFISCTQGQYYDDMSSLIYWLKKKSSSKAFLYKSGERLKWLSEQKTNIVKDVLKSLSNYRTITFCNSIEQSEQLGTNCIHSKNKKGLDILDSFNKKHIKHITCVGMLDEGYNLHDCRIGIFAMLNSSDRLIKQRLGRILRHKKPIIIIPYYAFTREEEIVRDMMEHYNPKLIQEVKSINELARIVSE